MFARCGNCLLLTPSPLYAISVASSKSHVALCRRGGELRRLSRQKTQKSLLSLSSLTSLNVLILFLDSCVMTGFACGSPLLTTFQSAKTLLRDWYRVVGNLEKVAVMCNCRGRSCNENGIRDFQWNLIRIRWAPIYFSPQSLTSNIVIVISDTAFWQTNYGRILL